MQFGRIVGVCLMALGAILCLLQFLHYLAPQAYAVKSSLPGIIGAASLILGIALFLTARRRDEPDPKYKVK